MNTRIFLPLLNVAFIAMFVLLSCSKEEKDDYEQTENISVQDPEGTVVLNMNSGADDNWYKIGNLGEIHIDAAYNFTSYRSYIDFVSVGLVKGLSKITQIPTTGWVKSIAVVPGTGYVLRRGSQYARLYVVGNYGSSSADEQGYSYGYAAAVTIKYQYPFQLPIVLENTTLEFSCEANSQTLYLKNSTGVTVEEKPEWCEVRTNDNEIKVTVTENLTATQRTGEIILKNTANSVTINVTQKGAFSPMFQAGSGTEQDPYQISTAQQLKNISKALNAHYILTSDIMLNEEEAGSGWDPIGKQEAPFTGFIDGQGHTISNLWMKRLTTNGVGLFGYISRANITNLRVETNDTGIIGRGDVGGICGYILSSSTISKVYFRGILNGVGVVGGICGECYDRSDDIVFSECCSEGSFTSSTTYGTVAGIVGDAGWDNNTHRVTNCCSRASLSGNNCYGISFEGVVSKCYYAGEATPTQYFYCGGSYTYYDSTIIGSTNILYRTEEYGRTTTQMMTQSNYEGWDFTNIWKITEGRTYPTLRCFDK